MLNNGDILGHFYLPLTPVGIPALSLSYISLNEVALYFYFVKRLKKKRNKCSNLTRLASKETCVFPLDLVNDINYMDRFP